MPGKSGSPQLSLLTTSTKSSSTSSNHGRSTSISKASSKLTSLFSSNRSARSVSSSPHSGVFSVPSIHVSPPGAGYEHPRPLSPLNYACKSAEEVKKNAQFGPIGDHSHRHVSRHPEGLSVPLPILDEPPYFYLITTYISYLIFIIFGHVRDFFGKRFKQSQYAHLREQDVPISTICQANILGLRTT